MKMKFYKCSVCGKITNTIKGLDTDIFCCKKEMDEFIPYVNCSGAEKHQPV